MNKAIGQFFSTSDDEIILVREIDTKLNSVDQEVTIFCGPVLRRDGSISLGWEYPDYLEETNMRFAKYVSPAEKKALESFSQEEA